MLFAQQDPHFGRHAANILGDNCVHENTLRYSQLLQSIVKSIVKVLANWNNLIKFVN